MKILPLILAIFAVCCICSSAAATMIYFSWDDVSEFLGLSKKEESPAPAAVLAPTYQTIVVPNEPPAPSPTNPSAPSPTNPSAPSPNKPSVVPPSKPDSKTPPNDPKTPLKTPQIGCPDPGCDAIVEEHNRVRAAHGVHEKLVWDAGLQAVAQARVNWNVANGKTGHDAFYANIERQGLGAGPENAYGAVGFTGAAEGWAKSVGHAPHTLGRNVTKVGCATHPNGGYMPSICVYDTWGKICGDPTICAAPTNVCRCHIDENGRPWGCC